MVPTGLSMQPSETTYNLPSVFPPEPPPSPQFPLSPVTATATLGTTFYIQDYSKSPLYNEPDINPITGNPVLPKRDTSPYSPILYQTKMMHYLEHELERKMLECDLAKYCAWSFKKKTGHNFIFNEHHYQIIEALVKVYRGEITNLIINMAPRAGKTELAVKMFAEWAYAKTKGKARFMHLSYSDTLATDNSYSVLETLKSSWYKEYWDYSVDKSKGGKGFWKLNSGGEFYAASFGGQIIGMGAGQVYELQNGGKDYTFMGCIIIDDGQKASDIRYPLLREQSIDTFENSICSRKNTPKTPIIIIMQRLHQEDLTGYCMSEKCSQKFTQLIIPAMKEDGSSFWEFKFPIAQLKIAREKTPSYFSGQMQQTPMALGGNLFKETMFAFGPVPTEFDYSFIVVDTAYTDKQTSDYTAMLGVKMVGDQFYIDAIYNKRIDSTKIEAELIRFISAFRTYGLRAVLIENRSFGIYLNQKLSAQGLFIPTEDDLKEFFKDRRFAKDERVNNIIPYLTNRKIIINENLNDKDEFVDQLLMFPNASHDDLVDVCTDAVKYAYARDASILDSYLFSPDYRG